MVFWVVACATLSSTVQNVKEEKPEVWYMYNSYGEMGSCTIHNDKILFRSNLDDVSEKSIDTVFIEKRLSDHNFVLRKDGKAPSYAWAQIKRGDHKDVLTMNTLGRGNSKKEVLQLISKDSVPVWSDLTIRQFYSGRKMEQLKKAPGLDKIKREDLFTSLQWRAPLQSKLEAYVKGAGERGPYMIYRFIENFQKQKLVELGYNPFKQVPYNFEKQFDGDTEILKLLRKDITFD